MNNLFDLTGKTALITGSSRGIGFYYAKGLAQAGAKIILNSTNQGSLDKAISLLQAEGYQVSGYVFDVANEAHVVNAFQQMDESGYKIDILINNAGIQHRQPLTELALKDWQRIIDVHLTATFLVSREVANRMIARNVGGKIINIGSLTSEQARATIAPYTAAKGGVKMLTKAMATEWGEYNIQVNAIGPGYIATEMNTALIENQTFNEWVKNSTPAQRWGTPEELMGTAIYLASSASNYVNGQIIYVDGGWLSML
ncbi:SDR family oxidoreductase [Lonepinella koalarum]|uniref:SDR family oxidoreductase n=1 Tax=Lonepinella koalarum TaxID=53417 RepID=UPI003F6E0588